MRNKNCKVYTNRGEEIECRHACFWDSLFAKVKRFIAWLKRIFSFLRSPHPEPPCQSSPEKKYIDGLKQFINKYLGVAVGWDGHFGAQCVDLVRRYWQEVEKIPQPEPTGTQGAIAFFYNHYARPIQRQHLKLVVYRPGMIPPPGAVIVFSPVSTNRFGHVGICVDADLKGINLFEQNGTYNSRALAEGREQKGAFVRRWDYSRVLGWLVKR